MSGGSYNYLCFRSANELFSLSTQEDLSAMSDRLAALGYAQDAARETEELLAIVRQATIRLQVRIDRLSNLWRAVEWVDSGDSVEDQIRDALAAYRKAGVL